MIKIKIINKMKNNIIKNLESLSSEIRISASNKKEVESFLMSEISRDVQSQNKVSFLMKFADHLVPANLAFKPVAVFSLIVGLLLVSSFGSVSAAKNTLPGDTLYPVKITAENIKYSLSFSHEAKAKVAMGMVETRVGELKVIVADEENGEREYKVVQTSKKIKDSLDKVKDKVAVINEETVEEIDKKLAMVGDEINEVVQEIENGEVEELAQVVEQVEEASGVVMVALEEQKEQADNDGEVKGEEDDDGTDEAVEKATTTAVDEIEDGSELPTTTSEIIPANEIIPTRDVKEILGIEEEEVEVEEFEVKIGI